MILKLQKKYFFSPLFAYILLVLLFPLSAAAATPLDGTAAIVNDRVITQSQVNAAVFTLRKTLQAANAPIPNTQTLHKQALEQLIEESLQLQVGERNNLKPSDAQVDAAIKNIATQNGISLDQLKQALANDGIDYDKFWTQLHDQIILRQLQHQLFGDKISVTDQEARNYIKTHTLPASPNARYKLDDLVIPLPDSPSETDLASAKQKAEMLRTEATRQNKAFSTLAAEDKTLQYNDLGWRTLPQLPTLFAEKIPSLSKGSIAGPLQAPNGFHIVRVVEKQGEGPTPLQMAKNMLYQEKLEKRVAAWIQQVRQTAYIKILD